MFRSLLREWRPIPNVDLPFRQRKHNRMLECRDIAYEGVGRGSSSVFLTRATRDFKKVCVSPQWLTRELQLALPSLRCEFARTICLEKMLASSC